MVGGSDGQWHESSQTIAFRVVPRLWELRWVQVLASAPWLLSAAVPVILVILAFNFLGDGVRDAADPYG